ncbi:MAG: hypothetical protein GQ573_09565 [Gammaproteobacteria bacterium]|nr:hypothetical protein [Gammaproteobacteria bacterium]
MNRLLTALLLSAFSSLIFSQQVFANRPAMQGSSEVNNAAEEVAPDTQHEMTSSVDIIMQQQTQQTGDVIQLPAKEMQPGETIRIKLLDFPRRGMSMDKVQNEYGQPSVVSDSIGQPPITSWTYNDRIVYFEYSTVLHVVAR